jgi:hypothetical protein
MSWDVDMPHNKFLSQISCSGVKMTGNKIGGYAELM